MRVTRAGARRDDEGGAVSEARQLILAAYQTVDAAESDFNGLVGKIGKGRIGWTGPLAFSSYAGMDIGGFGRQRRSPPP